MELGKLGSRRGWSDVSREGGEGGGGVGSWRIALDSWSRSKCRYKYMKLMLACCAALFLLSPALSRHLPSTTNVQKLLGTELTTAKGAATQNTHVERSEGYGRILVEAEVKENELEDSDDGNDYSSPTHNHNGAIDDNPTIARARMRYGQNRYSQKFSQYTAHYKHRRPSAK